MKKTVCLLGLIALIVALTVSIYLNVKIMNTSAITARGEILRPEYRRDFLHMNSTGYAALNQELEQLLTQ